MLPLLSVLWGSPFYVPGDVREGQQAQIVARKAELADREGNGEY